MSSTKRLLSIALSVLMLAAIFLTGCVGVNTSSTDEKEDGDGSTKNQTITLMTNDSTKPGWKAYQKKIEEATGVKLDIIVTPTNPDDMVAKMTTILSSGDNSIDLMHVNDELITAFSRAGYLEPLEKEVMTPDTVKNFSEQYIKDIPTFNGSIYSVPSYLEILAFWVNHQILKSAGMDVPKNKEEFLKYAKAATKNGVYGYGGSWEKSYVFNEIGTFVNLFGGDYFDWENPKTQEALKFMYDLAHTEKVTPLSQLADIYDPMNQKFIDGKYGMLFMYTGAIPTFEDAGKFSPEQLNIEPMPTFETNDAFIASWHFVLNKSSEKKAASRKVLQYIASPEGQLAYSEMSGRLPARLDVINDPSFTAKGLESVKNYISNSTLRGRPLVPQSMEFVNGIGAIFQKYVSDDISLEEAVKQAQKEIDRLAE
ncbi:sugar ABC transporter substrate-binding protein [Niallia nealsonii]|uniref:ABC transporter substrate-binding protein n=1 Tax=Niallia nealsonii TaxID=115979 RepID=A0A2N0Z5P7_9BACI|nr:extracellular solute-binding protein [Niallia nealsonii]PKG24845.1 ABC transporter substrate-binding protein [Niallia nealsonii]